MKLLVTGCFGFIGYNFLNLLQKKYDKELEIVGIDSLNFPTSRINHKNFRNINFDFYQIDINDIDQIPVKGVDLVINFAAESHVDNSISKPIGFIDSNVRGVGKLLYWSLKNKVDKFIHISTDEVYGSVEQEFPSEDKSFNPSSPYSASKAAAEHICNAFSRTYGQNIIMVRPSNNYGIYQQPEKLIPYSIVNLISGKNIEIYGEGKNIRHWLHVSDTCRAIMTILEKSSENEVFNIGSGDYFDNLHIAKNLIEIFNYDNSRITFVEDRLGHDFRYAVNFDKLQSIGWQPKADFKEELEKIVYWYKNNEEWWIDSYKKTLNDRKKRNSLDQ